VALATLVIGIAACGNDGDSKPTAPEAANATPRADAQDLGRYLMRRGEERGFRPGAAPGAMPRESGTITGVKALVNEWRLSAADERRLSSEGFISLTFQPIRGPSSAGVTEVSLYESAQGAKRSLAHDLRPVIQRPRYSRRAGLDRVPARRAGEPRRRERPLGAGSMLARPREPGPRSLRRPIVAGRAGDL
jgi:hypothetical protein